MKQLTLFDTTLRDGDQAAGAVFPCSEKPQLALALAEVGVDIVEAGFPLSSKRDDDACRKTVALLNGTKTKVALMCRARQDEIRQTAQLLNGNGVLHLTLPVSDEHISRLMDIDRKKLLNICAETVAYAAGLVAQVEVGCEDATRADLGFLVEYIETAIRSGATVINIADTLGRCCPPQISQLVGYLKTKIPAFNTGVVALSVHCHNDYGLATANTLAAIEAGCHQVEVTVGGIGERVGNASLEEVAAALSAHPEIYGVSTQLSTAGLAPLANRFYRTAILTPGPFKPLTGWNVNAHTSGIHQKGLESSSTEYRSVQFGSSPQRIVLSRHSGKAGVKLAALHCGLKNISDDNAELLLKRIKEDTRRTIGVTELLVWLDELGLLPQPPICCVRDSFEQTGEECRFTAALNNNNVVSGNGQSPEDAVLNALNKIFDIKIHWQTVQMTGFDGQYRVYAEIIQPDGTAFAAERLGTRLPRILFDIGLDAVNIYTNTKEPLQ
ncbi:MAG: hypothetical protein LBN39_00035 [Planctomycetaceae bacterium]|jgi:2-isopropylmalate synthase|nr:hypothetical protein [Planctomycetaceae bacterium]